MCNLAKLTTEARNQHSMTIDSMTIQEMLTTINNEDMKVAQAVKKVIPLITEAVEAVYKAFSNGGRLFYVGAGTSGRIGILDAVECPPTFSIKPDRVQAVMAGGMEAIERAVEGAEDDSAQGAEDLKARKLSNIDVVIGIAASGRTPYVAGALTYANNVGATTVSLTSNEGSVISQHANIKIEVVTGPEVLTGSTRMKAATAHKMVLNMITTSVMIKSGKVYENLMVDLKVSNEKLRERAKNIVSRITGVTLERAEKVLALTEYEVKPAIVMIKANVNLQQAKKAIEEADGYVRQAIDLFKGGK